MERTDIEVASRRVDMGSCLRPPSYPRGSFSVISGPHRRGLWGSLGPAFASGFRTMGNPVRPAFALTLYGGSLSHLSRPLGALDIFSSACRPSQTAHLPVSSYKLETQSQEYGVSLTAPPELASWLLSLPYTLHTHDQASTTDCSKALRGLRFPLEVSGMCTTIAGSLGSS